MNNTNIHMFFDETQFKLAEPTDETHCDLETKSILKPPKARLPLQEVDFGFDNTIDPDVIRKRRVSFAGIKIKEFNSKAESVIIGSIQAYEETFSTSSDSSVLTSSGGGSSNIGDDCTILNDTMDLTDIEREPGNIKAACKEKAIFQSDDFFQNNPSSFPPSAHHGLDMQNINLKRGGSDFCSTEQHLQPLYDPSKLLVKALLDDSNILEDMTLVQNAKFVPRTFFPRQNEAEPSAKSETNGPCIINKPFVPNYDTLKNQLSSKNEKRPLFNPFGSVLDSSCEIGNKSGMEFTGVLPKNFELPHEESLTHKSACPMEFTEALPCDFMKKILQQQNKAEVQETKSNLVVNHRRNYDEMDFTEVIPGIYGLQGNLDIPSKGNKTNPCINANTRTVLESSYAMDFTEVLQPRFVFENEKINCNNNALPHPILVSQNANSKESESQPFLESSQMDFTEAVVLPLVNNAPCTTANVNKENLVGFSNFVDSNNHDCMETSQMEFTEAIPNKFKNHEVFKNTNVNIAQNSAGDESFNMEITEAIPNRALSSKIKEHIALSVKNGFDGQKQVNMEHNIQKKLTEVMCFQRSDSCTSNSADQPKQTDFSAQSKQIKDLSSKDNPEIDLLPKENYCHNATQMEFTEVIPQMRPAINNFGQQTFHCNDNSAQMEFTEVIRAPRKSGICLEKLASCNSSSAAFNSECGTNKNSLDTSLIVRQVSQKTTVDRENISQDSVSSFNKGNNEKCNIDSGNMPYVNEEPQTAFPISHKVPGYVIPATETNFLTTSKHIKDLPLQENWEIHSLSKESTTQMEFTEVIMPSRQVNVLPSQEKLIIHLASKETDVHSTTQMEFIEVVPQSSPTVNNVVPQAFHSNENSGEMEFTKVIRSSRKTGICLDEIASCSSSVITSNVDKYDAEANQINNQICLSSEKIIVNQNSTSPNSDPPFDQHSIEKYNVGSKNPHNLDVEPQTVFLNSHKISETEMEESLKEQCITDLKGLGKDVFPSVPVVNTSYLDRKCVSTSETVPHLNKEPQTGFFTLVEQAKQSNSPKSKQVEDVLSHNNPVIHSLSSDNDVHNATQMEFTEMISRFRPSVNNFVPQDTLYNNENSVQMEFTEVIRAPRKSGICLEELASSNSSLIGSNKNNNKYNIYTNSISKQIHSSFENETENKENSNQDTATASSVIKMDNEKCNIFPKNTPYVDKEPRTYLFNNNKMLDEKEEKIKERITDIRSSDKNIFPSDPMANTSQVDFTDMLPMNKGNHELNSQKMLTFSVHGKSNFCDNTQMDFTDVIASNKNVDIMKKMMTPARSLANEETRKKMERLDEEWEIIKRNRSFFNGINFHWVSPVRWKRSLPFPLDIVVEINSTSRNIINIKLQSTLKKHDWAGSVEDFCIRQKLSLIASEDWLNAECKTMKDLLMAIEIIEEEYERLKPLIVSLRFAGLKCNPWYFKDNRVNFSLVSMRHSYHIVIKVNVLNYQKLSGDDIELSIEQCQRKDISQREVQKLFNTFEPSRERFVHFINAVKEHLSSS